MKLTMESTEEFVRVDKIPCRVLKGETEDGVGFEAFIPLVKWNLTVEEMGAIVGDDLDICEYEQGEVSNEILVAIPKRHLRFS